MSSMPSTPPPPPAGHPVPAIADVSDADQLRALHLLRAMIAAANADGVIDDAERAALGERARAAGLDDEEVQALDRELGTPLSIEQLVLQTPEDLREQVYIAALVAIEPDTDSEQRFHADLATGLRLDPATQVALRQQLGLA